MGVSWNRDGHGYARGVGLDARLQALHSNALGLEEQIGLGHDYLHAVLRYRADKDIEETSGTLEIRAQRERGPIVHKFDLGDINGGAILWIKQWLEVESESRESWVALSHDRNYVSSLARCSR